MCLMDVEWLNALVRCRLIELLIVAPRVCIWHADKVMSGILGFVVGRDLLWVLASSSASRLSRR